MNSLKVLALIGVAATSVSAHDDQNERLLQQKQDFLQTCSREVPMCEFIISKANEHLVIVDPVDPDPIEPVPVDPSGNASELARQCVRDFVAVCVPALDSSDPTFIAECLVENRKGIFDNVKNISEECKQAFRDLAGPHRRRRHAAVRRAHHGHHGGHKDKDRPHHRNGDGDHHHHENAPSEPAQKMNEAVVHLNASGADIGACLLSHTQNLTAPCLSAVEFVNATDADWGFLDVEEEEGRFGHAMRGAIACVLLFLAVLTVCCCYYKKRTVRGPAPAAFPGSAIPFTPTSATNDSSDVFPGAAINNRSPAPVPAMRISYNAGTDTAYANRPMGATRPLDVEYTGAANRERLLSGAVLSDQYI